MAEHVERSGTEQEAPGGETNVTQALPPQPQAGAAQGGAVASTGTQASSSSEGRRRRAESSVDWSKAKEQIVGLLAGVARWLGVIFAVILVLNVIFVIGEANEDNGIATFMREWASTLSIGFEDLFTPDDAKLRVLVNHGAAAIFWLVVSSIVAKIIRRVGDSIKV